MGTFGLGGLHKRSTWLPPVATFAALPPTAIDGSVAVTLDTNLAWEYDASLPGWVPFAGGGGINSLREVVIGPFTGLLTPGTALNVQTGVYVGPGSPAPLTGDVNVTFPAAGALFKDDGRIEVHLNGQELTKGDGSGNGVAEWVSTTQIKFGVKVKPKDEVLVRAPFPTA